jgi:hypothetical protein
MNLTSELLEMWEEDAKQGSRDNTQANARILKLVQEVREQATLLREQVQMVIDDPFGLSEAYREAFEELKAR